MEKLKEASDEAAEKLAIALKTLASMAATTYAKAETYATEAKEAAISAKAIAEAASATADEALIIAVEVASAAEKGKGKKRDVWYSKQKSWKDKDPNDPHHPECDCGPCASLVKCSTCDFQNSNKCKTCTLSDTRLSDWIDWIEDNPSLDLDLPAWIKYMETP